METSGLALRLVLGDERKHTVVEKRTGHGGGGRGVAASSAP